MDLGTVIGLIAGFSIITFGIINGDGNPANFINWNSVLIVLGGTIAATLVNYPLKVFLGVGSILKNAFTKGSYDYIETIEEIVEKAEKARKNGLLSLEGDLDKIESSFLRKGIDLAINERDAVRLREYLNLELNNINSRHVAGQEMFLYMGSYAPAFGMLGTVLGLIVMMNNFGGSGEESMYFDVSQKFEKLLGGMGLALITTFYGVLLSNLVFLPIGGKLKRKSEDELMLKNIAVEGIISIHAKEHPLLIREKLMTFIPSNLRVEK